MRILFGFLGFAVAASVITSTASAQDRQARWLVDVATANGDSAVQPGEVATITLSVEFSPGPGERDPISGERVWGFGHALLDVRDQGNWPTGEVTWAFDDYWLLELFGDVTKKDGDTQELFGVLGAQFPSGGGLGAGDKREPIPFVTITWDPRGDYSPRDVAFLLDSRAWDATATWFEEYPEDTASIWATHPSAIWGDLVYPLPNAEFSFQVVPAPGGLGLLIGAGLFGARRPHRHT